jgi:hypothetical protein
MKTWFREAKPSVLGTNKMSKVLSTNRERERVNKTRRVFAFSHFETPFLTALFLLSKIINPEQFASQING